MTERHIINALVSAVFLMATLNLGAQFCRGYIARLEAERLYRESGMIACNFGLSSDEASRFYIELALLSALIGSRIKNPAGGLPYGAGLTATMAFYLLWWRYYFVLAKMSESEMKFVSQIAYLYHATYWDLCIAVSVIIVLLWEVKFLALAPFRPTNTEADTRSAGFLKVGLIARG